MIAGTNKFRQYMGLCRCVDVVDVVDVADADWWDFFSASNPVTSSVTEATMQTTAPVYSAPTTYAAPGMMYAAPGGQVPVYGAPGAMPMPVQTMTMAPTYAAPVPSTTGGPVVTTGTPAEPVQGTTDPVMTTTTAVETAVSTQTFPPAPRTTALQTIMGQVTQAWESTATGGFTITLRVPMVPFSSYGRRNFLLEPNPLGWRLHH